MRIARIGGPIALMVIGAILRFAVANMVPNVDLTMIGLILLVAGAIWLVIELLMAIPRSRRTSERTVVQDEAGRDHAVEREIRQDGI